MFVQDSEQLDLLTDDQLWEVAANHSNTPEIRQEAIQLWLFPDETLEDADPDALSGGRLRELKARATVIDTESLEDDDIEDIDAMAPYFDVEGQMILFHDGVSYLIESQDDSGAYEGVSDSNTGATTDDKTLTDMDL